MSPQRAAQREAEENARRRWSAEKNEVEAERYIRDGRPELAAILYETNGRLYRRVGDHAASREAWRKSRELREVYGEALLRRVRHRRSLQA